MLLILLRLLIFSVKFVRYMLSSGRTYSSVWHLVDKDGNYHNIVYSQDL
ncbi:hypothetical protein GYH30_050590, partial [Glycine max]